MVRVVRILLLAGLMLCSLGLASCVGGELPAAASPLPTPTPEPTAANTLD